MLPEMCRRGSYLHYSGRLRLPCQYLPVARYGFAGAIGGRPVEHLVGRGEFVVGDPEAHHHAGDPKVAVEDSHDRDGPAAADVDRLLAELLLWRLGRRGAVGIVRVGLRG